MLQPYRAARACSTVPTENPFSDKVVPLSVDVTFLALAAIIGLFDKSVLSILYP